MQVKGNVRAGEDLRICGSAPSLGRNDPASSVPLLTSSNEYPWWNSKSIFLSGDIGGTE